MQVGIVNLLTSKKNSTHHCLSVAAGSADGWCFAGILDKLDDGVIVVDNANRTVVFCNAAAEEILQSLNLAADYKILTRFLLANNISIDEPGQEPQSHPVMHNNRIIKFSLHALPDQSACLQVKDITEEKRLESIAQAVNTMDNLGFIFSGIRHEIGNPLNSIKMTNSVLQKNLDHFSLDDIRRYIDRSASEITRMEYLLKSLKNFSMYEKIDCQPHGLNDFLATLLALIKPDLETNNIGINCQLPSTNIQVNIDPRALHQALLNILTNAADAVRGQTDATIDIKTTINGRLAWISIEDNGCGMTAEQIRMLFQPFYTNKPHGNGLGLVITQKLLTMMQASLDINSRLNEGSRARIGLPLTRTNDGPEIN